jgi:hypothetical protein
LHRILAGRGEVIDDFGEVGIVDRRAMGLDHFRHFDLSEVLLEFRSVRLGVDAIRAVKQKPRPHQAARAHRMPEPRFDQYSQTLMVRRRGPNGVITRRVT